MENIRGEGKQGRGKLNFGTLHYIFDDIGIKGYKNKIGSCRDSS